MSEKPEPGSEFERRTREVLEDSTARLDGRTLSRLTQARHAALDQVQRAARARWIAWLPAGAAAAVAALALVTWPGGGEPVAVSPLDDLEMIADTEAPDFVDDGEELEFYEWVSGEVET